MWHLRRLIDKRRGHAYNGGLCGCSSMVERQLPKLHTRVRFPSPAPTDSPKFRSSLMCPAPSGFFVGGFPQRQSPPAQTTLWHAHAGMHKPSMHSPSCSLAMPGLRLTLETHGRRQATALLTQPLASTHVLLVGGKTLQPASCGLFFCVGGRVGFREDQPRPEAMPLKTCCPTGLRSWWQ